MTTETESPLVDISAARDTVRALALHPRPGEWPTISADHGHVAAWCEELAASQARIDKIKELAKALERRELEYQQSLARIAGGEKVSEKAPRWTLGLIEAYVAENAHGKSKHVDTIAGRIQMRDVPAGLLIPKENEERLIRWCRDGHGDLLKVEVRVRVDELKAWITTTGEIPADVLGTIVEWFPKGRYQTVSGAGWKTPPVVAEEKEAIEEESES